MVIGRLRLVVASDLLQAVAPPLVYAARRARGRLASSLRTASWSRPRTLSAIQPSYALRPTNRERRVGPSYRSKRNHTRIYSNDIGKRNAEAISMGGVANDEFLEVPFVWKIV